MQLLNVLMAVALLQRDFRSLPLYWLNWLTQLFYVPLDESYYVQEVQPTTQLGYWARATGVRAVATAAMVKDFMLDAMMTV